MRTITFFTTILLLLSGFTYAQQTYVPDDNFENYLETHDASGNTVAVGDANSMGNGIANDDYVLTSRINTVTSLNVANQNIADLTGIEYFAALQYLNCSGNQLTSLDVTQNTNLQTLYCDNNQLTALDVNQNTALQRLSCSNNQLTAIDVSQNTNLRSFYCYVNQITSLDVSQNTSLIEFVCYANQLTNLDMRNAHNNNLITFTAIVNPDLTCVFVDDAAYMNANHANHIDATATYVETQAECDALGIDETFKETISIYPNPVSEYLSIQVQDKANIKSISIQNMQGQVVYQSDFAPQIKLADLPADMYFLRIENKTGDVAVFKLIKD